MTEKVKLTQEQAKAIERYKRELVNSIDEQLRFGVKRTPYEWADPLFELGGSQVLELIKHGYEVEETFEVGDWVTYESVNSGKVIIKIIENDEPDSNGVLTDFKGSNGVNQVLLKEFIRHATPEEIAEEKQRRWWAKHDRKVWEIREGDVVINPQTENVLFVTADIKPSENDKKTYRILCFAEDRKDLEVKA